MEEYERSTDNLEVGSVDSRPVLLPYPFPIFRRQRPLQCRSFKTNIVYTTLTLSTGVRLTSLHHNNGLV